jgi:hypothetical protein
MRDTSVYGAGGSKFAQDSVRDTACVIHQSMVLVAKRSYGAKQKHGPWGKAKW